MGYRVAERLSGGFYVIGGGNLSRDDARAEARRLNSRLREQTKQSQSQSARNIADISKKTGLSTSQVAGAINQPEKQQAQEIIQKEAFDKVVAERRAEALEKRKYFEARDKQIKQIQNIREEIIRLRNEGATVKVNEKREKGQLVGLGYTVTALPQGKTIFKNEKNKLEVSGMGQAKYEQGLLITPEIESQLAKPTNTANIRTREAQINLIKKYGNKAEKLKREYEKNLEKVRDSKFSDVFVETPMKIADTIESPFKNTFLEIPAQSFTTRIGLRTPQLVQEGVVAGYTASQDVETSLFGVAKGVGLTGQYFATKPVESIVGALSFEATGKLGSYAGQKIKAKIENKPSLFDLKSKKTVVVSTADETLKIKQSGKEYTKGTVTTKGTTESTDLFGFKTRTSSEAKGTFTGKADVTKKPTPFSTKTSTRVTTSTRTPSLIERFTGIKIGGKQFLTTEDVISEAKGLSSGDRTVQVSKAGDTIGVLGTKELASATAGDRSLFSFGIKGGTINVQESIGKIRGFGTIEAFSGNGAGQKPSVFTPTGTKQIQTPKTPSPVTEQAIISQQQQVAGVLSAQTKPVQIPSMSYPAPPPIQLVKPISYQIQDYDKPQEQFSVIQNIKTPPILEPIKTKQKTTENNVVTFKIGQTKPTQSQIKKPQLTILKPKILTKFEQIQKQKQEQVQKQFKVENVQQINKIIGLQDTKFKTDFKIAEIVDFRFGTGFDNPPPPPPQIPIPIIIGLIPDFTSFGTKGEGRPLGFNSSKSFNSGTKQKSKYTPSIFGIGTKKKKSKKKKLYTGFEVRGI